MQYNSSMKRDMPILVRLTEDEKKAFVGSANFAGITLSGWIRQNLRMAANQKPGEISAFNPQPDLIKYPKVNTKSPAMSKLTEAFERSEGLYTVREVAFYARMHPSTVRSWFYHKSRPRFRGTTPSVDDQFLSFTDLIEAIYVRKLRREFRISFPVIRTAIDTAKALKKVDHPFAHPDFRTVVVGKSEITIIERGEEARMVSLAPDPGQISDTTILEQFIDDLEFDNNNKIIKLIAFKAPTDRIIITPDFNFGAPMLEKCKYPAEILWLAKQSEGGLKEAAEAYEVDESTVQAAVDYYESILNPDALPKAA